jgi:cobalt/nickel transport system permease protein
LLVTVVAPRVSSDPDGLERVAIDQGFAAEAEDGALGDSPLAGYGSDTTGEGVGTVAAGLIGLAVTFVAGAKRDCSSMSGTHTHALFVHGDSELHRLPASVKLGALGVFVIAVVLTPRQAVWAFGVHAGLVSTAMWAAGLRPLFVMRRLVIEIPFVLFAVALPFVAGGEQVELAGLSLSVEGLWGGWNIIAKATLGLAASILLTATTTVPDILAGLDRLRVPRLITSIAGFMVRYLDVIAGEMHRMRMAMLSRGHDPRWFWQAKAYVSSAGALFIRSYERGERVYFAMTARGFDGRVPVLNGGAATVGDWSRALVVPAVALVTMVVAVVL